MGHIVKGTGIGRDRRKPLNKRLLKKKLLKEGYTEKQIEVALQEIKRRAINIKAE